MVFKDFWGKISFVGLETTDKAKQPKQKIIKMSLTLDDFKSIIEQPRNQDELALAHSDNERMSFHARRSTSESDISEYFAYFKRDVNKILIPSKQAPFWALWSYPLATTQIISEAADELNKVFSAKDKSVELKCKDEEQTRDFHEYEDEVVCEFFEYKVFNAILERPNSFIVVDLPTEQEGDLPEPYPYLIPASLVYDISIKKDKVEYIVIKKKDSVFNFIDEQNYYTVSYQNGLIQILSIAPHGLGYCPVFPIWNDNVNEKGIRKVSPTIDILEKLDDYVFKYIQKKFLDLYADSPILEKYETKCGNSDCQNGYIVDAEGQKKECQTCSSNRKLLGAGSVATKPMPDGISGDLGSAASWITVPVESLNYTKEKLTESKKEIFEYLTGYVKGQDRTEAINQDQIYSQLESRKAKLNWWSENISHTRTLVSKAVGQLRYGDSFVSANIEQGSQFHIWTIKDSFAEYELAKKNSMPMFVLSSMRKDLIELLSDNSEYKEQRLVILQNLEPYADIDLTLVPRDTVEYELKSNFSHYINEFELANGDIVNFGSLITFSLKIMKIKAFLMQLAEQNQQKQFETKKKYIIEPVKQTF